MRLAMASLGAALMLAGTASAQDSALKLNELHDALHLSADQEDAWRSYRAATMPSQQGTDRHRSAAMLLPQLQTPRRIALIDALMQEDNAEARRRGQSVLAFYNRLTPDQQRTFDRQTLPSASNSRSH